MQSFIIVFSSVISLFFTGSTNSEGVDIHLLWLECRLEKVIPFKIFEKAYTGYSRIENLKKKNILTIIDYSVPSSDKRFYVIDLEKKKLLYRCLVAHGKNSGDFTATSFSNRNGSLKSSLGFYITAETYVGEHGYSLKLDGLEKNINDNARMRDIVIHGADYVSDKIVTIYGRPGRSWGCPALPVELAREIMDVISHGSCLFIYADDKFYNENSILVKK